MDVESYKELLAAGMTKEVQGCCGQTDLLCFTGSDTATWYMYHAVVAEGVIE